MFQLIVAVVAIALVAVMILGAVYWGGDAHQEATIRADYAANMNAASQIEGAMQMYYNDTGMNPPGKDRVLLDFLVTNGYLSTVPEGDWRVAAQTIYKATLNQTVEECRAINRVSGQDMSAADLVAAGYEGCPPCNGAEGSPELALAAKYLKWPGCQFIET